jgi:Cu(I)/Ag(I) efflux system membrane protein CusA/SilA
MRPESSNPVSRVTQAIYLPVLSVCLRFPNTTVLLNLVFLALAFPLAFRLGSQFMPPLFEGASLSFPLAAPRPPKT